MQHFPCQIWTVVIKVRQKMFFGKLFYWVSVVKTMIKFGVRNSFIPYLLFEIFNNTVLKMRQPNRAMPLVMCVFYTVEYHEVWYGNWMWLFLILLICFVEWIGDWKNRFCWVRMTCVSGHVCDTKGCWWLCWRVFCKCELIKITWYSKKLSKCKIYISYIE